MALSNWDRMFCDKNGKTIKELILGEFKFEVYKNWMYIWHKKDLIHTLYSGEIHIDVGEYQWANLYAVRGPQQGIYAIIKYHKYYKDNQKPSEDQNYYGIGVYGYEDDDWVGIKDESKDFFTNWMRKCTMDEENSPIVYSLDNDDVIDVKNFDHQNQGDAFFEEKLGITLETPTKEPLFSQIMNQIKKDNQIPDGNNKFHIGDRVEITPLIQGSIGIISGFDLHDGKYYYYIKCDDKSSSMNVPEEDIGIISEDPMKNLDEESSKIILDMLKKSGVPTKLKMLKNARIEDNKVIFDLEIEKKVNTNGMENNQK